MLLKTVFPNVFIMIFTNDKSTGKGQNYFAVRNFPLPFVPI